MTLSTHISAPASAAHARRSRLPGAGRTPHGTTGTSPLPPMLVMWGSAMPWAKAVATAASMAFPPPSSRRRAHLDRLHLRTYDDALHISASTHGTLGPLEHTAVAPLVNRLGLMGLPGYETTGCVIECGRGT